MWKFFVKLFMFAGIIFMLLAFAVYGLLGIVRYGVLHSLYKATILSIVSFFLAGGMFSIIFTGLHYLAFKLRLGWGIKVNYDFCPKRCLIFTGLDYEEFGSMAHQSLKVIPGASILESSDMGELLSALTPVSAMSYGEIITYTLSNLGHKTKLCISSKSANRLNNILKLSADGGKNYQNVEKIAAFILAEIDKKCIEL